ncbi:hypothetical protein OsJ_23843 [Oryza sativa Japonica Group]|uniref:4-coumarate--CoA ligase n=1 Tax=Oryza sativa subsp. japonica TaxID=39947 RepID=A3BIM0_ORYSJ|nr:hypothetical protein OsJ_23843 [Oryza sativa Japonica Group]
MANADGESTRTGYCAATKSFRSLRPPVPLPPPDVPLSFPEFAFSLLPRSSSSSSSSLFPANPALVDAATGEAVSFQAFLSRVRAFAGALRSRVGLRGGDVAFVLAPAGLDVPVLYFALLSIGAVVSPANPALTPAEVSRLVSLSGASVAFAVSSTATKLPAGLTTVVLLDSPHFRSLLMDCGQAQGQEPLAGGGGAAVGDGGDASTACGDDGAGEGGGAGLHRSFIAMGVALGATTVVVTDAVARAGIRGLVEAAERWAVMDMTASPPVVLGMTKQRCRLPALERITCGGAPLPAPAIERFRRRFPHVDLCMGYGSTEAGGISRMISQEECNHIGSAGRVTENVEVKIVDHVTGKPLPAGQQGELWVRGPAVMTGYVGDNEANATTFNSEGWLKTGDLCYIDQDGFLFVVDRLKELIKYKAYQVPPAELELVLHSLPQIVDAAVMPYPHEEAGQIPVALVVKQPGSKLTEAEVMYNVAKQVAPYKKIRKVLFVDSIPKSPSGKILRRELVNHLRLCELSRL